MKPGDKVIVTASDEQLESMGMTSQKINDNLRKYESTISEELVNAKCKDENGVEHSVFVLDSTFTMPGLYLKVMNDEIEIVPVRQLTDKEDEEEIEEEDLSADGEEDKDEEEGNTDVD